MIIIGHHPPDISIHALRKESDLRVPSIARRRVISIHALRKESDSICLDIRPALRDFNPRSP